MQDSCTSTSSCHVMCWELLVHHILSLPFSVVLKQRCKSTAMHTLCRCPHCKNASQLLGTFLSVLSGGTLSRKVEHFQHFGSHCGAASVAINGSSSESNCVGVLTTRLATFLAEPVCHSKVLPRQHVLGSVPCVCLHPQQSTLEGCRWHLTHSCTGPTGSHVSDSEVGPSWNCPQQCHRRSDHPHQERKEPHGTGPCGVCEKGLDVILQS